MDEVDVLELMNNSLKLISSYFELVNKLKT